jgi:hypothetical protein
VPWGPGWLVRDQPGQDTGPVLLLEAGATLVLTPKVFVLPWTSRLSLAKGITNGRWGGDGGREARSYREDSRAEASNT